MDSIRTGAVSVPLNSSRTAWRATAPAFRRAGPGCAWAGARAESFNATPSNERAYQMVYPTRDIALWIEVEYNQKLLHSTLGYRIANEVEGERRATRRAA